MRVSMNSTTFSSRALINDAEFSLEFGLGGSNKAVFSNCKWETAAAPTRVEELVSLKAAFVAKTVAIS
jgi:hypothetical protein